MLMRATMGFRAILHHRKGTNMAQRAFVRIAGTTMVALAAAVVQVEGQQPARADTVEAIPLAPVSVTVLRTPLAIEEVPYAVTVQSRIEIQRGKPGISVEEALRIIPGVQVDNRFNYALGERISVRGFGARAPFGVRGVRVVVDGIPATLPDGQSSLTHVDVKSLGRVEVIRGPMASLYGNNAGGVIQMEMQQPPPFPITQGIGVIGGSNGLLRLQSTTAGTSGDLNYQLNLARLSFGGYREHSRAENYHLNARFGFDRPDQRLRFVVSAGDSDALNPGGLNQIQLDSLRNQAFVDNKTTFVTGKTVREGMAGASYQRTLSPGSVELAGYFGTRDIVNPIPNTIVTFGRNGGGGRAMFQSNQFTVPGTGGLGLRFAVGAEADAQRDDRQNYANARGERGALRLDQLERVNNLSGFGQLSVHPLSRLTLLGGLRYDWFEFEAQDRFLDDNRDDSGTRTMKNLSPSVGATVVLSDAFHVYGNIGQTFETPTTVELANRPDGAGGFNPELDPQTVVSKEIGLRGRVADRLAFQLSTYDADVENSLVVFQVAGRDFYRNAAQARHKGWELGLTLAPIRGLTVQSAWTYTGARFVQYTDRQGVVHDGNRVPGVAPYRLETSVNFAPRPSSWYLGLENRRLSSIPVNDANDTFSRRYSLWEVRGGLEGFRLGSVVLDPLAGITNLLDTEYNTAVSVNAFRTAANRNSGRYFEPGPGRAFYVGGNIRVERR
jgi:iron complex outermembrane recepter protein